MKNNILLRETWIQEPRDKVFPFFCDPANLKKLTPPWLNLTLLTRQPVEMREGLLLDYRFQLFRLPLRWQSEITRWEPPFAFVDTQRRGPYRVWEHLHQFEEKDGGTLMTDRVEYRSPGGPLVERLAVDWQLKLIFDYRTKRILEIFQANEV